MERRARIQEGGGRGKLLALLLVGSLGAAGCGEGVERGPAEAPAGVQPGEGGVDSAEARDSADDSAQDSAPDTSEALDTSGADTSSEGPSSWRSELYPEDWTPGFSHASGAFLHDFSYAGYHEGETPPRPTGPLHSVLEHGADPSGAMDSTAAIQAAIDAASTAGGGVVWLPEGTYRVEGLLAVASSGAVIRGAGAGRTFVWFTQVAGMSDRAHLTLAGSVREGPDLPLASEGAQRSTIVEVADASSLRPGDRVHLGWTISEGFIEEHGMSGTWVSFTGQWKPFFRRTVRSVDTSVAPHRVELDVPLRYPAKLRDGASLRLAQGYLREVGVEDLSVSTVMRWEDAWSVTRTHAILLSGVEDGWVRGVSSFAPVGAPDALGDHLASGGLKVLDSRRVSVLETHLAEAQNRGVGGNGYLFEVSRSGEVLTADSSATGGRHNFIQNWDFGTSGCVWLRTRSAAGRSLIADWDPIGYPSYSEYHHSLAMANLVDQSWASDGWQGVNRRAESSGAGHSATENVFWNLAGGGYLRSLQYGLGYVVGTSGGMDLHTDPTEWDWNLSGQGTLPVDWVEGVEQGERLEPASLYEDQRSRRLSAGASSSP